MPSLIRAIDTWLLDVPTIRPHRLAVTSMQSQTLVLVRLQCTDGFSGWGEATTIGGLAYGEESPESIKTNIDTYIAPLLLGQEAKPGPLMHRVASHVQGNRFAKCAIETALYDLLARQKGVPLSDLFGGRLRDSVPVAWTLASGDTARDIAEAEKMIDSKRHCIFKLKIGLRDVLADVAHVAAIKRALGEHISIRVDANQAWSMTDAMRGMRALADAGIDLVEQPVAAWDVAGLRRLTQSGVIPVMADEALHGAIDAMALATERAADVFAIKINQSGGLKGAALVAGIAESSNVALYGGTMLEGAIGTIASAQLFACWRRIDWATELFGPLLLTQEILQEPLVYRDHALQLPTGPGLGIEPDMERIRHLRRI